MTIDLDSDRFTCEVSAEAAPILEVPPGTTLSVHCRNALDYAVGPGPVRAKHANPATGPVAVTGAYPGQALRLDVLDIVPEAFGYIAASPEGGHRRVEIRDGEAVFDESIRVPIAPMIGVLGVASAEGSWQTMECGPFGGNLDTNDLAPAGIVVLPVFQPGGLFVLGDVHAVMGDGEIGGQGLEVAAEVTLRVGIEPEPLSSSIYLFRNDEVMTIGTSRSLDDACDRAARAMASIVAEATCLDEFSAGKFLGLAGHLRVGQQCCATKSARVAVPLRYLPNLRPRTNPNHSAT